MANFGSYFTLQTTPREAKQSSHQQVVVEANLKGKARAWEKATLDYNGNLK
jgi:hypothetical protein